VDVFSLLETHAHSAEHVENFILGASSLAQILQIFAIYLSDFALAGSPWTSPCEQFLQCGVPSITTAGNMFVMKRTIGIDVTMKWKQRTTPSSPPWTPSASGARRV